jgi:hypothetical protein
MVSAMMARWSLTISLMIPATVPAPTQPGEFSTFGELPAQALRELLELAEGDLATAPLSTTC